MVEPRKKKGKKKSSVGNRTTMTRNFAERKGTVLGGRVHRSSWKRRLGAGDDLGRWVLGGRISRLFVGRRMDCVANSVVAALGECCCFIIILADGDLNGRLQTRSSGKSKKTYTYNKIINFI